MFSFAAIGLRLLGIRKAIGSAFAWVTQSMTRILAVLLVLTLLWGLIERNSRIKAEKVLASTETAYRNAQKDAELAQQALNAAFSARSTSIAKDADHGYEKARTGALSRADDYIARNRVQSCPKSPASRSDPAAESGAASVPEVTAAPAIVAISDGDVRACSIAASYAMKAHETAVKLVDAGLAEWAGD